MNIFAISLIQLILVIYPQITSDIPYSQLLQPKCDVRVIQHVFLLPNPFMISCGINHNWYQQIVGRLKFRTHVLVHNVRQKTDLCNLFEQRNDIVTVSNFNSGEIGKSDISSQALRMIIDSLSREMVNQPSFLVKQEQPVTKNSYHPKDETILQVVQSRLHRILTAYLPEPHGSLLEGILLGIKTSMSKSFYDALINTGTVHVIAASGFNITLVAKVTISSLSLILSKKKALILSFVTIAMYAWLAGASPAVIRASLMGFLAFGAVLLGREYWASWGLIVSSLVMVLYDVTMLENVSFWLSVASTAGILWLSPVFATWVKRFVANHKGFIGRLGLFKLSQVIINDFSTTLGATLMTWPIIWLVFDRVSWLSPFVNVFVLWLVPPIMLIGALKLIVGFVSLELAYYLGLLAWMPLEVFVRVVTFFGSYDIISINLGGWKRTLGFWGTIVTVFVYYAILLVIFIRSKKQISEPVTVNKSNDSKAADLFVSS